MKARRALCFAWVAIMTAGLASACGGPQKSANAPAGAPREESVPGATTPTTLSAPTSTAYGTGAPVPPSTAPQFAPRPADVAWSNLVQGEQQLDAAASDCANACRALGSMDRATGQLCSASGASEDQARCDDAKGRLLRARDRVRGSCGGCPGGPTVDHDAPIPSPP
jgi:hypothetical protein